MAISYGGKRVIVSGGGGAGMGAAAVTQLVELGAEVHVLDRKDPPVAVASHQATDLTDPEAMEAAVEEIGGQIDCLFNCVGVAGPPFVSAMVTMLVNFVGVRHLSELVTDRMPKGGAIATITSTAGVGWQNELDTWLPLLQTDGFQEASDWCEGHIDEIGMAYGPSKKVASAWTQYACNDLGKRGIRINCTMPGPTQTPMFPEFEEKVGADFWSQYPIPLGRFATPEDQANALIFLNSDAASCISGVSLIVDGGTVGAAQAGTISLPVPQPKVS